MMGHKQTFTLSFFRRQLVLLRENKYSRKGKREEVLKHRMR